MKLLGIMLLVGKKGGLGQVGGMLSIFREIKSIR